MPLGRVCLGGHWHTGKALGSSEIVDPLVLQFLSRIAEIATRAVVEIDELAQHTVAVELHYEDRIRNAIEDQAIMTFRLGERMVCLPSHFFGALVFAEVRFGVECSGWMGPTHSHDSDCTP